MQLPVSGLANVVVVGAILGGLSLLTGCGKTNHGSPEANAEATSGGAHAAGGAAAAAGSAGSNSAGENGGGSSGAATEPVTPPADVSGRWALFVFEDPVGVQLIQTGEKLAGVGCAAGAPPLAEDQSTCGDITGEVHGQAAWFWFGFQGNTYRAATTVSADGQRMTGSFHGVGDVAWSTAWLRVPDGEAGLARDESVADQYLHGLYQLDLDFADDGGTEYTAAQSYELRYIAGNGIASDLGSFWHTEIHFALSGVLEVGPLPLTSPELAHALKVETDADGIVGVWATTGTAHNYHFIATREML